MNDTSLPPIERPKSLIMKLAYAMTRREFGKVLTPLKVHSARLPAAFGLFYAKIAKLDKKLVLSPETILLIREQVARTTSVFSAPISAERLRSNHRWMRPNQPQEILSCLGVDAGGELG